MKRKSYSINQSPLYGILGLNQLEKRLNIKLDKLRLLLKPVGYRHWVSNDREIQYPVGWLGDVHKNMAVLLARIEMPEYVFSKKGKSYVDNAYEHVGYHPISKTDISKFYPSTSREMVKTMFVDQFKCAKDVAGYLADICCYQQKHLPTGSYISGYLAYFANKTLFDQVDAYAKAKGCTFTLYVDDLTISGKAATGKLINKVRCLINEHGLRAKRSKTKTYSAYDVKEVTGNILKGNQILLPNRRHKDIYETRKALVVATNSEAITHLTKVLNGRIRESQQIKNVNDGINMEKTLHKSLLFA